MARVNPDQWKRKRGRPKKDDSVLPGQTTFIDSNKSDEITQKLELITKDKIKDTAELKKAVREYKFLNNSIKKELKNLFASISEIERPVMERVNEMRIKSADLLDNITAYSKDNVESVFTAVPGIGRLLDLGDYEVVIKNKQTLTIKSKIAPAEVAAAESDINHGTY